MRALILSFSPCGTTDRVACMYEQSLDQNGWTVHRADLTGNRELFVDRDPERFLAGLPAHDLLLAGGPVYIDHLQYNLADLLARLPLPVPGSPWGRFAALFVAFGKVSPGLALAEGARILSFRGRSVLSALEADCTHCLSRHFTPRISPGLPGPETRALVNESTAHLTRLLSRRNADPPNLNLMLQSLRDRVPDPRDERTVLQESFPPFEIDPDLCQGCLNCVRHCPVCHLTVREGRPVPEGPSPCIHCTRCLQECPTGAIRMDLRPKQVFLTAQLMRQNLDPAGASQSRLFLS